MRVFPATFLTLVLLIAFGSTAAADAVLERFFGTYGGFGRAEDTAGAFITTERNFALAIRPLGADGFEVAWATGKRKGSDPNNLEAVISRHTAGFQPSQVPGIYHQVDSGSPLLGESLGWARLRGAVLIVYQFDVGEDGIPELHVYRRTLTPKGLELQFTASRDGKLVRTVRGRYSRQ